MEKRGTAKKALVIGAGIAALSAAAYALFGPNGKKNRRAVKGWALKMYGEIMERMERAKEFSEPVFNRITDEVSEKYAKLKNIDQKDLDEAISEIKRQWKKISKNMATQERKSGNGNRS